MGDDDKMDIPENDETESIEEIIQDELQRAKEAKPIKLSFEAARQSDAAHKISKTIFDLIVAEPYPYFFDFSETKLLIRLIRRAGLHYGHAHSTFDYIEMMLQEELHKNESDSKKVTGIMRVFEILNYTAVQYFEEYLLEELNGVHIAEILQRSKATLIRLESGGQKYFRQAVESVKEDAERRIEHRKEEKSNRDQMYEPEAERDEDFDLTKSKKFDDRMKRQKDRGLTRESAYLFVDYLLEFAMKGLLVKNTNIQRAAVVEFLTGYSLTKLKDVPAWFKNETAKIKENSEIDEKIFNDLKIVRKQFETLRLQDIVDRAKLSRNREIYTRFSTSIR
ncbi:MAG: hypothetical protein WKF92_16380 [Pyrinomonadaceae bacterium]